MKFFFMLSAISVSLSTIFHQEAVGFLAVMMFLLIGELEKIETYCDIKRIYSYKDRSDHNGCEGIKK